MKKEQLIKYFKSIRQTDKKYPATMIWATNGHCEAMADEILAMQAEEICANCKFGLSSEWVMKEYEMYDRYCEEEDSYKMGHDGCNKFEAK